MDWFRLYAEFANDPKVQMMSEAMQRRLIMLFCLQCSNGLETFHETDRAQSVGFALRLNDDEVSETHSLFVRKGFINDDWTLCNWSKRQYASDSSTARVRAFRDRKKQDETNNETDVKRFSNALEQNRTEQNREEANASVVSPAVAVQTTACPADAIVSMYHELLPNNPKCKVLSESRRRSIRQRWKEAATLTCKPFGYSSRSDGLAAWRAFFETCAESDFLTGKTTPQPGKPAFVADIDFLMSPSGFTRTLENKYHREVAA